MKPRTTNARSRFSWVGLAVAGVTMPLLAQTNGSLEIGDASNYVQGGILPYLHVGSASYNSGIVVRRDGHAELSLLAIGGGRPEIRFGDGVNAYDVNMYRSSANILKTDDRISAGLGITVNGGTGAGLFDAYNGATLRTMLNALGTQIWRLNAGAGEVGEVAIGTPRANPGITFKTGSSYDQNRFDIFNAGSRFSLGYNAAGETNGLHIMSTGNVGIGTTSPEQKLQVVGGRFQVNTAAAWDNFQIYTDGYSSYLEANGDESGLFIRSNVGHKVIFDQANVGIGTPDPGIYKLAVNGTIKAKEVIVETTGWSDYVFADDYRLAPLSEVEAHIKAERRLPGIPSEQQVADQGVSLGEMQAALLAKVEELTLHLIEQDKVRRTEMEELSRENDELRRRVQQLEQR